MLENINPSAIAEGEPEKVSADMRKFNKAKEQVALVRTELQKYKIITTKETQDSALEVLKVAKKVDSAIEAKRKQLVAPWNDQATKINAYVKELIGDAIKDMETVKKEVLRFQEAEAKKALDLRTDARKTSLAAIGFVFKENESHAAVEGIGHISIREVLNYTPDEFNNVIAEFNSKITAAAAVQQKAAEETTSLDNAFSQQEIPAQAPVVKAVTAPIVSNSSYGFSGNAKGTTKTWAFDITDATLVPREYMIVNDIAIREAVRAGVRTIPGVNIFQKTGLTIR